MYNMELKKEKNVYPSGYIPREKCQRTGSGVISVALLSVILLCFSVNFELFFAINMHFFLNRKKYIVTWVK